MIKLVKGIVDFREKHQAEYREKFSRLVEGQSPDALLIACSDSRVVPNTFASTDPGDLFVVRNVGNLIPCCGEDGVSCGDHGEASAIEYAVLVLGVSDIIVCGHSECGAMGALLDPGAASGTKNIPMWLESGRDSLARLKADGPITAELSEVNQLSQSNVLAQLDHIRSYPIVKERLANDTLRLHGWWFDIKQADIYSYSEDFNKYILLDRKESERIIPFLKK